MEIEPLKLCLKSIRIAILHNKKITLCVILITTNLIELYENVKFDKLNLEQGFKQLVHINLQITLTHKPVDLEVKTL